LTFKPNPDPADPIHTPPDRELRMERGSEGARDWLRARRGLVFELPALVAACFLLTELAPVAEASVFDAQALWVACFALFSMATLGFVRRGLEVLDWECPRCSEPFCGRRPYRTRCAHCGFRPGGDEPPSETAGR
jgi:hypothetical protein